MTAPTDPSVRDASTIILLRPAAQTGGAPAVLMGQRGRTAAFMPGKFVFPGGAVDPADATVPLHAPLRAGCRAALVEDSGASPDALAAAAIRELWEETGQVIGAEADWPGPPRGWRGYAAQGLRPTGAPLEFIFRAVTPPGRSRRFDTRFFLAPAEALRSDPDDFSQAEDELSQLQWIALDEVRRFDLPFITQVVLAELTARIARPSAARDIPFFRNDDERLLVSRLAGQSPLDAP